MTRVLLVAEQCNPEWASVPLVAFNLWDALSRIADVHLVTHARNRAAMEPRREGRTVSYIEESVCTARYAALVQRLTMRKSVNWPLFHALSYPVYAAFNRKVYARFAPHVQRKDYDVVHAFTPVLPRYPVALAAACTTTPFVLGPVNGGLPFPAAFGEVSKKEHGTFNVLRACTRLMPGYAATYRRASLVLAGSRYTMSMLAERFPDVAPRMTLFHENGLAPEFFRPHTLRNGAFSVLFVGRLVPYKGADMLLDAFARSGVDGTLVIVGDGTERSNLEAQARSLGLMDRVHFTGWVAQKDTADFYAGADVFAFPSVREFGGAVVLEAMAAGLPCIVVDHGGIGEYVDDTCGIRIAPLSRQHVVDQLAQALAGLAANADKRHQLEQGAHNRAEHYRWHHKANWLVQQYAKLAGNTP